MRLRISASLFSSLFLLAACGESAPPPTASAEWAIVDGERTAMNEDSVVAVLNRAGGLCTGSLIASRVVLTAKHCVQNPDVENPSPPSSFVIGIGDNIRGLTQTFGAIDVWTTEGSYSEFGLRGLVGQDIAVITLRSDAPAPPFPVYRGDPLDLIGTEMKAVGFGETPAGGAGVKYRVGTTVSRYAESQGVIYTPPTICQGDSGGPLLTADGQIAGIASFGSACGVGENGYNHVAAFLENIDDVLRAAGACTDDGEEACDGGDNDCDGLVDETCLDVGETCTSGDECLTNRCEDTDGGRICTQDCDPVRPFTGCGTGLYCAQTDGCDGRCEPGAAGTLAIDEECTMATDCASLHCADPGDGVQRCLDPCVGDAGMCLHGEVCVAGPGTCGGCVPEDILSAPRGLGEPCEEDGECQSGSCLAEAGDSYCTRGCATDDECGSGYHCRVMEDPSSSQCVRGDRSGAGQNCIDNLDCSEGLFCAVRGDDAWCTLFCGTDEDCPAAFSCLSVGEASLCAPDLGIVGSDCTSDEECISDFCQPLPDGSRSVCTRFCDSESTCAPGFACVRSADGVNSVCIDTESIPRNDGGGCAVGGAPPVGAVWWLSVACFFFFRRKVSR
ncbi:MAG: S1 family peptidase [Deltaproteobacteria bacterium]|nr:S1 family peptidase [Deltaproteobacteria bacterium]